MLDEDYYVLTLAAIARELNIAKIYSADVLIAAGLPLTWVSEQRLLSFEKYAKDAQPDVLVTLIQSFVERIYIVDENDERYCHIFIKGCTKEDYDEFFRATGYISGTRETGIITSKLYLCDSDECCKNYMIFACPFCV